MKKHLFLFVVAFFPLFSFAQTAIGTFQSHLTLSGFVSVAADKETIYAAGENGLLLLDKSTMYDEKPDISSWSKVEGLSDISIVKLHCDRRYNALVICYSNGNIDIIRDGKLLNIRDVKDKSMSGSKIVQSCRTIGDKLFLVYPFGIVIIDMENLVIADTWFTKRDNEPCLPTDIALFHGRYFVSTTQGVFSIPSTSAAIPDFSQWSEENDWNVSFLASMSDKLVCVRKASEDHPGEVDSLGMYNGSVWMTTEHGYSYVRAMSQWNDTLVVCRWDAVELLDGDLESLYFAYWYENARYPDARDCLLDGDVIWAADRVYGLVCNNMTYYSRRFFTEPGPFTDYVEDVSSLNGLVVAVHGTMNPSNAFAPAYHYPGISWYQNQEWRSDGSSYLTYDPQHNTYDLAGVAIHPKDDSQWAVSSWGNGVFLCKNKYPINHYNAANSVLDSTPEGKTFVSGVQYDKKGNLWMTNSRCPKMLKMLEPNGTWHSYNITNGVLSSSYEAVIAEKLLVDSRGYKWVNFRLGSVRYNLVAFSDNGTYDNLGDDRLARIDMNAAAEVTSSNVYCMAEDLDGEIWIGTDKGVKVIYYPSRVFDGNAYPRNILLEQDGYVSVLLEFEEVTAIAVDGANRKWIGTNKAGVFLMSENGQEQLLHFTAEDHPLFSNQIVDININDLTGEVFFATAKGMVSYKGEATGGKEVYEDLLVYPNPVPHDYSGAVAVTGLKANSLCKITDSSGKLVWQGYSSGGQLVWYCKDHFGKRPASGVYYVMISDEDGKDKIVTKFVFIN